MKLKTYLIAIAAAASLAGDAAAQSTAFTYQGTLNQSGTPATGSFDFQFTLKNAASGGGNVGTPATVTAAAVPVVGGTFSATLDFGSSAGAFGGADRWLEIAVRPAGAGSYTTLSPRQPVTPTPAALYATATSDLGVIAAKAVNLPNTNVPAHGTAGVSGSALYVRTAPSGSAVGRGGIVHHQDSNFAIRETAANTGTADGARLEYDAVSRANPESVAKEDILVLRGDGNVGIGTNSPAATLDVRGDIRSNNNPIYFRTSGDNYHGIAHKNAVSDDFSSDNTSGFDGPILWGYDGGALGSLNQGGDSIALSWKNNGSVEIPSGNIDVQNGGLLSIGDRGLFHIALSNTDIQTYDGSTPNILHLNPNGGQVEIGHSSSSVTAKGTFYASGRLRANGGFFGQDSGALPQSFATGVRVLYDPSQSAGQIYTYDYTNNTGKQLKLGVPGGGAGYDPGIVFSDPIVSDAIFKEDIFLEGYLYNWWDGAYRTLSRDSITGNAHWSDERLKEEIATIPDALSTLHRLRGVKFQWNEEGISRLTSNIETEYRSKSGTKEDNEALWAEKRAEAEEKLSQTQYGFIAQELEKVFPDWVLTGEDGYKKINVEQMTGVIVQGVNELNERTTAQAATIANLQSENASLKSQLAALEKQIADQAALDAKFEARLARLEKAADTKKQTVSLK